MSHAHNTVHSPGCGRLDPPGTGLNAFRHFAACSKPHLISVLRVSFPHQRRPFRQSDRHQKISPPKPRRPQLRGGPDVDERAAQGIQHYSQTTVGSIRAPAERLLATPP